MTQADCRGNPNPAGEPHGAVYQSAEYRALSKINRYIHRRSSAPGDIQAVGRGTRKIQTGTRNLVTSASGHARRSVVTNLLNDGLGV